MYRLWWISRREASEGVHRKNTLSIEFGLRARGFTCHPARDLVMRVPADARVRRLDVKRLIKRMFRLSYMQNALVASLMWNLRVVYEAPRKVGAALNTTKACVPA